MSDKLPELTPTSLKAFYEERANLAYSIEHSLSRAMPAWLKRYVSLQEEIASLQAAFTQTWLRPHDGGVALLPWCSVCGRNDQTLLPGRMLCSICAAAQMQDGGTALLPWCSVCGRDDRAILPGRMLCSVCAAAQTEAGQ